MDAVSDVLRVVRLGGAVYLNGEFTAPWCVIGQTDSALCTGYLPRSETRGVLPSHHRWELLGATGYRPRLGHSNQ